MVLVPSAALMLGGFPPKEDMKLHRWCSELKSHQSIHMYTWPAACTLAIGTDWSSRFYMQSIFHTKLLLSLCLVYIARRELASLVHDAAMRFRVSSALGSDTLALSRESGIDRLVNLHTCSCVFQPGWASQLHHWKHCAFLWESRLALSVYGLPWRCTVAWPGQMGWKWVSVIIHCLFCLKCQTCLNS